MTIARAARTLRYPAAFMLVAAMNPCRCGHHGDPRKACICSPPSIKRYGSRISGPLLDRVDLHVEVPAVTFTDLASETAGERSDVVAARVLSARRIQSDRSGEAGSTNSRYASEALRRVASTDPKGRRLLESAMTRLALSARAHDRILRVARTIADLESAEGVRAIHIAEAIQYRAFDRKPPEGEEKRP